MHAELRAKSKSRPAAAVAPSSSRRSIILLITFISSLFSWYISPFTFAGLIHSLPCKVLFQPLMPIKRQQKDSSHLTLNQFGKRRWSPSVSMGVAPWTSSHRTKVKCTNALARMW